VSVCGGASGGTGSVRGCGGNLARERVVGGPGSWGGGVGGQKGWDRRGKKNPGERACLTNKGNHSVRGGEVEKKRTVGLRGGLKGKDSGDGGRLLGGGCGKRVRSVPFKKKL